MYQFLKATVKWNLTWRFKVSLPIYHSSKMHFIWPILFNFTNIRYLFLLICIKCAKDKKQCKFRLLKYFFTINSSLKMLPRYFQYFYFSNLYVIFVKCFTTFYYVTSFTSWQPLTVKWRLVQLLGSIYLVLSQNIPKD